MKRIWFVFSLLVSTLSKPIKGEEKEPGCLVMGVRLYSHYTLKEFWSTLFKSSGAVKQSVSQSRQLDQTFDLQSQDRAVADIENFNIRRVTFRKSGVDHVFHVVEAKPELSERFRAQSNKFSSRISLGQRMMFGMLKMTKFFDKLITPGQGWPMVPLSGILGYIGMTSGLDWGMVPSAFVALAATALQIKYLSLRESTLTDEHLTSKNISDAINRGLATSGKPPILVWPDLDNVFWPTRFTASFDILKDVQKRTGAVVVKEEVLKDVEREVGKVVATKYQNFPPSFTLSNAVSLDTVSPHFQTLGWRTTKFDASDASSTSGLAQVFAHFGMINGLAWLKDHSESSDLRIISIPSAKHGFMPAGFLQYIAATNETKVYLPHLTPEQSEKIAAHMQGGVNLMVELGAKSKFDVQSMMFDQTARILDMARSLLDGQEVRSEVPDLLSP